MWCGAVRLSVFNALLCLPEIFNPVADLNGTNQINYNKYINITTYFFLL